MEEWWLSKGDRPKMPMPVPDEMFHVVVAGVIGAFLVHERCPIEFRPESAIPNDGHIESNLEPVTLGAVTKSGIKIKITIEYDGMVEE